MAKNEGISRRLRELRLRLHRKQVDMARLIGVTRQAWSLYEKGQRLPNPTQIGELALNCGVSTDWLILGKADPPKEQDGN